MVAINLRSVDGVMETIRMLGLITGHLEEAKKLISETRARTAPTLQRGNGTWPFTQHRDVL